MKVSIRPSHIEGVLEMPASKSQAHRALIAAALSNSPVTVVGKMRGTDIEATADCLRLLGAVITPCSGGVRVSPIDRTKLNKSDFYVKDSGSTLRFMLPVVAALGINATFDGGERLRNRPLGGLVSTLRSAGVSVSADSLPFEISGNLNAGEWSIDAGVSSQYVSGLMLAAPIVGGAEIKLKGDAISKGYIQMTVQTLRSFGISVTATEQGFAVDGRYVAPEKVFVDGDYSSACFAAVAAALRGNVTLKGLDPKSVQSDKMIFEVLRRAGAVVSWNGNEVSVTAATPLKAVSFNAENCPDLVPAAAVLCAAAVGTSSINGISRLRLKESDRVAETIKMLYSFGIDAVATEDELVISGGQLKGCMIRLPDDHRLAMAAAVAAVAAEGGSELYDAECVAKSYPEFFTDLKMIGGNCNVQGV